mgnify:CR=1 FL=1
MGKNKRKVVDLAPKAEKISEEQLKKLQSFVGGINKAQMDIGMLETRKHQVLHTIAEMQDEITLLQQEFDKDYGTFDVNVNDGTINYPEK